MQETISALIRASIDTKQQLLKDETILNTINDVADLMTAAFKDGKRAWFCGNGGSAADAQHLAAELSGRFYLNRVALPAEALHCNTSYLTAVANDFGYDVAYARLVEGIMGKGDVLLGFSTSGNSPNILAAFEMARSKGVHTVGLTGETGGKMRPLCDYLINIPSKDTPRIQESHILVGHIVCQLVEAAYFPTK
ncbi:D-sedoheptulose-7-phosphate isomerase [Flavihumibacter petaseus]|uniref:Phosphoheptose isomerase n=1 Tax=Flavihumibacter petaseus NBRC 106054 TaxID=1220578 RepID=A0A0E9N7H8_9BACT|nr:D-sedoheptulose 7-phosphate isomerase [Flavihumibacter petaseus]GAO45310.1 phosphoheptose isomerase [Flavihumibacter petaseus NBRC 106054]